MATKAEYEQFGTDDIFSVLGLDWETATDREINKAYRKLSLKCHPDKHPDRRDEFDKIKDAKEFLLDEEKKAGVVSHLKRKKEARELVGAKNKDRQKHADELDKREREAWERAKKMDEIRQQAGVGVGAGAGKSGLSSLSPALKKIREANVAYIEKRERERQKRVESREKVVRREVKKARDAKVIFTCDDGSSSRGGGGGSSSSRSGKWGHDQYWGAGYGSKSLTEQITKAFQELQAQKLIKGFHSVIVLSLSTPIKAEVQFTTRAEARDALTYILDLQTWKKLKKQWTWLAGKDVRDSMGNKVNRLPELCPEIKSRGSGSFDGVKSSGSGAGGLTQGAGGPGGLGSGADAVAPDRPKLFPMNNDDSNAYIDALDGGFRYRDFWEMEGDILGRLEARIAECTA